MKYNVATREVEVLLTGLAFANGVQLSPDESYVLVNETWKFRVMRYWLKGPKAGKADIFAEGLPGFIDNIRLDKETGTYWIGIFTPPPSGLELVRNFDSSID